MNWERAATTVAGRQLAYRRSAGRHRPLLYLHDAGADTLVSAAFDDLASDHDVVLLDLPGYGRSDPPAGISHIAEITALLTGLLDALGWAEAIVAGTSIGGWFGLELALERPERVSGLVASGAAGLHTPEDYLFALFAEGRAAAGTQELIHGALLQRLAAGDRDISAQPAAVAAAVVGPFVQNMAAAAAMSWHPYTANPRLLGRLATVRCPMIVLWGELDALIPLRHGRLLAAAAPGAQLRVVRGAGHLLALEEPALFAAAVRELAAYPAGRT